MQCHHLTLTGSRGKRMSADVWRHKLEAKSTRGLGYVWLPSGTSSPTMRLRGEAFSNGTSEIC
jgi:hypothetical protein